VSAPETQRTATDAATLERRLGPLDAAAIVVSNVIGSGIFFVPILVAGMVPSASGIIGVWLLGGLLAFAGAMAYAELAALRPRAGGEYVYLRDAFGPIAAFLTGWTSFVAGFSGAIATNGILLAEYIGRFLPSAADQTAWLTIPIPFVPLVVTPKAIVGISVVVGLSVIHISGLGPGRLVHNVLASVKVLALVLFVALGLSIGSGSFGNLSVSHSVPLPATGWLLALIPIMFSYSGWNAAAYVAEEIRNPGRNLPIALAVGTGAVVLIYLGLNVLYLYALPPPELSGLLGKNVGLTDVVAQRLFGDVAGTMLALLTIVSIAASISAMVLAGPRVYYAMARDGVFPAVVARVHTKFRTPAIAIVVQAVWSSILILASDLATLVSYTGFAVMLFAGVAVAAVFVLRWREPNAARPFSTWGYPVAPGIFVFASLSMVLYSLYTNNFNERTGLAIIGVGLPLYFVLHYLFARKRASS
jgi:APA family basic amino acid/polyamine antiporter